MFLTQEQAKECLLTLERIRDGEFTPPDWSETALNALNYAIELMKLESKGELIRLNVDYWEKYYDIIETVMRFQDTGEFAGRVFKIVKEEVPTEEPFHEDQPDLGNELASMINENPPDFGGGMLASLLGNMMPSMDENIIDGEAIEIERTEPDEPADESETK